MKKNLPFIIGAIVVVASITGFLLYKSVLTPKRTPTIIEEPIENIPLVDASIQVNVTKSKSEANTVVLSIKGMAAKMKSVSYELTYDSQGITQGTTGKDVDVTGKDAFERSIYLGTCSRNVCRPHPGVKSISLTLIFTDLEGKQSQFTKDYPL